MRVKTERLDGGKTRVEVTLTSKETESALLEARAAVVDQLGLKVDDLHPAELLAKEQFDIDDFDAVVAVQMAETLLPAAVDQAGVVPAFLPEVQQSQLPKGGCSYSFSFVLVSKPEFELSSYGPVTVEMEPIQISDEQVKQVLVDIAMRCIGSEEAEAGAADVDYSDEWLEEHLPFESSLEDTKDIVREELALTAQDKRRAKVREAATLELAKSFDGDIPAEVLDATRMSVFEDVRMALAHQGIDPQEYFKGREEVLKAQMSRRAYSMLAQGYVLDAVFRHAELTLEEEDIDAWCASVAPGQEAADVRREMEAAGQGFLMREGAQRLKAGNWLADRAIVVDK